LAVTLAERKLLYFRRDDTCASCGLALPAGSQGYWLKAERHALCLACGDATALAPPAEESVPGASARQIYERRREARENRDRERYGRIGGWKARMSAGPQHERAWAKGAVGEAKNARRLEKLLDGQPVELLHDRRLPGRRANIDHIAIGPGGVTVIDSKNLEGKVRIDWRGGLFSPRQFDLYVGRRRRTNLVESVEGQVEAVRQVLLGQGLVDVPVAGALCMADVEGLPLIKRLKLRDVAIDGPRRIAKLAARPGPLDPASIEALTLALKSSLPPA
jgi:hypothetical protein